MYRIVARKDAGCSTLEKRLSVKDYYSAVFLFDALALKYEVVFLVNTKTDETIRHIS